MRSILLGASLIALSTSAVAAAPHHKSTAKKPDVVAVKSAPVDHMAEMLAMFDKLFPPQPDPDPARLALARTSAAALWPTGAYGKLMTNMMGTMYDRVMQMKASDLPGGMKAGDVPGDPSLHTLATMKDPYFDQRAAAMRQVVEDEAGQVSAIIDPRIRDGLARSMARRFDERQLADINAFFLTPSGHALASQYMQMWVDPDMMRSIFSSMPDMMKLAPDMMVKMKAAAEKYPAPPKAAAGAAHGKS
jgi:hypothetical protein